MAEILKDAVTSPEELQLRADNLGTLNGMELVFVELDTAATPPEARLTVEFFNDNGVADMLNRFVVDGDPAASIFRIRGGRRRTSAASCPARYRCTTSRLRPAPPRGWC